MLASRQAGRAALRQTTRSPRLSNPRNIRFQSTTSSTSSTTTNLATGIGGGLLGAALFAWASSYTPTGRAASKVNSALTEATKKYNEATKTLQQKTPNADEAVSSIKQFAYSYVGWIPGGRQWVDKAFEDWEAIRKEHKEEADEIVNDAYKKFQDLSKSGLSLETASKAYEVLADLSKKVAELSGDAIGTIVDNHPQLKEKFGGNIEQLKSMGEKYGPEAKKQVDETWKEIRNVLGGGLSAANLDKIRKLIEEKVQQIQKLGDQAWQKGYEELKPQLEKNPKIKELVENNADALKQGNVTELFDKAKSAVQSGDFGDLQEYVNKTVEKAKSKGSDAASQFGLDKYLNMVPQGGEVWSKLQEIGQVAEKHGDKGKSLLKETVEEIKQVLEKKGKQAGEIAEEAKKDVK